MTDLVERLREYLMAEAADEIERLRGEVRALQKMIGEIDRQHAAEIERLRVGIELVSK